MAKYIKFEDALNAVDYPITISMVSNEAECHAMSRAKKIAAENIRKAPTVDGINIKGKWIAYPDDSYTMRCSNCNTTYGAWYMNSWHFCPACGADMRIMVDENV